MEMHSVDVLSAVVIAFKPLKRDDFSLLTGISKADLSFSFGLAAVWPSVD